MNKLGKAKEVVGWIVSLLIVIGICLAVILAISGTSNNEVNNAVIGGAWYIIGLAILFIFVIVLIIILFAIIKKQD